MPPQGSPKQQAPEDSGGERPTGVGCHSGNGASSDQMLGAVASLLRRLQQGTSAGRDAFFRGHPELAATLQPYLTAPSDANKETLPAAISPDPNPLDSPEDSLATLPLGTQERGDRQSTDDASMPALSAGSLVGNGGAEMPALGPGVGLPRRFGHYELLSEIARGGMGVVYKARQVGLNRLVAVKMILTGSWASEQELARFRFEAEAAASLQHPNIVAIHEVGEQDGQSFFSMDFIEGQSLQHLVATAPLPAARAAGYLLTIASAIQYAHERGVLHRDLKPSNVLLDKSDQPRVTDFGLAKRSETDSGLTASGAMVGTPSYMPPEQAMARHDEVGPASDVYSLGCILYELVTCRPPFNCPSALDTIMQVVNAAPVSPRTLNPQVPADLETICLKCLEKQPTRRYSTAAELATDIGHFLAGRPIAARPVGPIERAWRWSKRQPLVAGLAASVAVSLVGGAGIASYYAIQADRNAREAGAQAEAAETSFEFLTESLDQKADFLAGWLAHSGRPDDVQTALLKELKRAGVRKPSGRQNQYDRYFQAVRSRLEGDIRRQLLDTDLAKKGYAEAIGELERLAVDVPKQPKYRFELARAHVNRAWLLLDAGGSEAGQTRADLDRAIELLNELHASQPGVRKFQWELGRAHFNRGILAARASDPAKVAPQSFNRAVELLSSARNSAGEVSEYRQEEYQKNLARSYLNRALQAIYTIDAHSPPSVAAAADADLHAAIGLLQELSKASPTQREYRHDLAEAFLKQGRLALAVNNPGVAQKAYQRSVETFADLVRDFPRLPGYREDLARSQYDLGKAFHAGGHPALAAAEWNRTAKTFKDLVEEYPRNSAYRNGWAATLDGLASLVLDGDEAQDTEDLLKSARTHLELAVEQQRLACRSQPDNAEYREALRYLLGALAEAFERSAKTGPTPTQADFRLRAAEILAAWLNEAENVAAITAEDRNGVAQNAVANLREFATLRPDGIAEIIQNQNLAPLRGYAAFREWKAESAGDLQNR